MRNFRSRDIKYFSQTLFSQTKNVTTSFHQKLSDAVSFLGVRTYLVTKHLEIWEPQQIPSQILSKQQKRGWRRTVGSPWGNCHHFHGAIHNALVPYVPFLPVCPLHASWPPGLPACCRGCRGFTDTQVHGRTFTFRTFTTYVPKTFKSILPPPQKSRKRFQTLFKVRWWSSSCGVWVSCPEILIL